MAGFGKGSHLHLIDGSGFIFRAYHALPPLTRKSDGLPIGAVAGFSNMVWKMLQETKGADAPTHVAVVFDKSEVTFRNELYSDYKQNRPPAPDDLVPQFRLIRDATRAFNLPCIEMAGFEADDIIATYATQAAAAGGRVTIISADKDLMQLVAPGIVMFDTLKNKPIGPRRGDGEVRRRPRAGDRRAGAGRQLDRQRARRARDRDQDRGAADRRVRRPRHAAGAGRRDQAAEAAGGARRACRPHPLSRDLVTLRRDVPLEEPLDALEVRDPEADTLLPWLAEMEFRGLAGRVSAKLGVAAPTIEPVAEAQQGPAAAFAREPAPVAPIDHAEVCPPARRRGARRLRRAHRRRRRGGDRGRHRRGRRDAGAARSASALAIGPGEAAYLPIAHVQGQGGLFDEPVVGQVPLEAALAILGRSSRTRRS